MNQPKVMRDLYCANPGMFLVEADYKALEAWILALISGDAKLLELLSTGDIHTATAHIIFGDPKDDKQAKVQRELAKRCRYALHYGARPETAWQSIVVDMPQVGLSDICKLFNTFEKLHPGIIAFHKEQIFKARTKDHIEAPLSGRRHHFHGQVEPAKCYNLPIQMTAADLISAAMLRIEKLFTHMEHIIIQVHDSLVCEGTEWQRIYQIIRQEMERPVSLNGQTVSFPIDAKWGTNWGNMVSIGE